MEKEQDFLIIEALTSFNLRLGNVLLKCTILARKFKLSSNLVFLDQQFKIEKIKMHPN